MAVTNNVKSFLTQIGQGVKPNMFVVDINFPAGAGEATDKDLFQLMCKSAALPGSNLGVIEVPFRGRTVKIAGDRTFDTWSATFFNDKNMQLRAFFEEWANELNSHEANTAPRFLPNNQDTGYMADLFVTQLEKDDKISGSAVRTYHLHHCFPTNVSQIDLAYDSNDQIEEFTVEWQYSFFTATKADSKTTAGAEVKGDASPRPVV